jgi:hypothetical protein
MFTCGTPLLSGNHQSTLLWKMPHNPFRSFLPYISLHIFQLILVSWLCYWMLQWVHVWQALLANNFFPCDVFNFYGILVTASHSPGSREYLPLGALHGLMVSHVSTSQEGNQYLLFFLFFFSFYCLIVRWFPHCDLSYIHVVVVIYIIIVFYDSGLVNHVLFIY